MRQDESPRSKAQSRGARRADCMQADVLLTNFGMDFGAARLTLLIFPPMISFFEISPPGCQVLLCRTLIIGIIGSWYDGEWLCICRSSPLGQAPACLGPRRHRLVSWSQDERRAKSGELGQRCGGNECWLADEVMNVSSEC